jgi:hypothetical protein
MERTDRLSTANAPPTADQVRADVARAVAGLEAWHGEIARRRRELDDEDRELEEMELSLTCRQRVADWVPVPAVNGNGVPAVERDEDEVLRAVEVGAVAQIPGGEEGARLDVDEHFEAMFVESQAPAEPDDEPDVVLDLQPGTGTATVTEEMPAGGAVDDWRDTAMGKILAWLPADVMTHLENDLQEWAIETVGDLCTFLTDEDNELDDIRMFTEERAQFCHAMEAFRKAQGWDESTTYPAGIPGGWFEGDEAQDLAAIAGETRSRAGERPSGDASEWAGMFSGKEPATRTPARSIDHHPSQPSPSQGEGKKSQSTAKRKKKEQSIEVITARLREALAPKLAKWEKLRASGADDATLNREIFAMLGTRAGTDWSASVDGQKWWATSSGVDSHKAPTLQGPELCQASRSILEIPPPSAPAQEPAVPRPGRVPGGGKKGAKVAPPPAGVESWCDPHPPKKAATKDGVKPMTGTGKPRALPDGGVWTDRSLVEARERLDWRSHREALFVCDKPGCGAMFFSHPGKAEPCPECGGRKRHTYNDEELAIRKREPVGARPSDKAAMPRASGAARRAKAKARTAAPVSKPDDYFVPEPIGGWSMPKLGEAARDLLGEAHRELERAAALVCCEKCRALRKRLVFPCPPCGSEGYRSYARITMEIVEAGKRVVEKSMANDRATDRGAD